MQLTCTQRYLEPKEHSARLVQARFQSKLTTTARCDIAQAACRGHLAGHSKDAFGLGAHDVSSCGTPAP